MAAIYRKALQVFTYLGPRSKNLKSENGALGLLEEITTLFEPHFVEIARTLPGSAITNPKLAPLMNSEGSTKLDSDHPHWVDLLRIIYSGWTHRLWMVQENILCPNTHMLRGCRLLSWISAGSIPVLFSIDLLPESLLLKLWPLVGLRMDPTSINGAITRLWRFRMDSNRPGLSNLTAQSPTLALTLFLFLDFQCKDRRDRVYAVLGSLRTPKS